MGKVVVNVGILEVVVVAEILGAIVTWKMLRMGRIMRGIMRNIEGVRMRKIKWVLLVFGGEFGWHGVVRARIEGVEDGDGLEEGIGGCYDTHPTAGGCYGSLRCETNF